MWEEKEDGRRGEKDAALRLGAGGERRPGDQRAGQGDRGGDRRWELRRFPGAISGAQEIMAGGVVASYINSQLPPV